jgi:hypothetical protein
LHGNTFEYLRNEALDARNFFSPTLEEFRRNQFGGTVGGPIRRDKVFFFVDYQGTRETRGVDSGIVTVLTDAQRQGNFSSSASSTFTNTVGGGLASPYFATILSQRLGYGVESGEPYFTPGCINTSQCVFPGGIIPESAFSSASTHLLQYIPAPNTPSGGGPSYASTSNDDTTDDRFGIRLDGNTDAGMPGFPTQDAGIIQYLNLANTAL